MWSIKDDLAILGKVEGELLFLSQKIRGMLRGHDENLRNNRLLQDAIRRRKKEFDAGPLRRTTNFD